MAQPTPRFPCGHPGCEGCADGDPARCDHATPLPALPADEPPPVVSLGVCAHGRRPGAWCAECAAERVRLGVGKGTVSHWRSGKRVMPREAADVLAATATAPAEGDAGRGVA